VFQLQADCHDPVRGHRRRAHLPLALTRRLWWQTYDWRCGCGNTHQHHESECPVSHVKRAEGLEYHVQCTMCHTDNIVRAPTPHACPLWHHHSLGCAATQVPTSNFKAYATTAATKTKEAAVAAATYSKVRAAATRASRPSPPPPPAPPQS
jgi:hypothetical protein